jgi:hypothetical protein
MVYTPQIQEKHDSLQRVIQGCAVNLKKPKNAFKYPDSEGAAFPQHEVMKPIDCRASHLPMAQYAFRGNRRKYSSEELDYMKDLAKSSHPKMEVLAGGGAILAKNGKRVSLQEAAVEQEANAAQLATPASSSSAVAAAIAEDAAAASSAVALDEAMDSEGDGPSLEPSNSADHTRLPVVKDTRRSKRTAEKRPRAKKGKTKGGR